MAAMIEPGQQRWFNDLYSAVRISDEGYYEDSITLLCLLGLTGNDWSPSALPGATPGSVRTLSPVAALLFGASLAVPGAQVLLRGGPGTRLHSRE